MMVVQIMLFLFLRVTHSLVPRLSVLTALLGNKDKSLGNIKHNSEDL